MIRVRINLLSGAHVQTNFGTAEFVEEVKAKLADPHASITVPVRYDGSGRDTRNGDTGGGYVIIPVRSIVSVTIS